MGTLQLTGRRGWTTVTTLLLALLLLVAGQVTAREAAASDSTIDAVPAGVQNVLVPAELDRPRPDRPRQAVPAPASAPAPAPAPAPVPAPAVAPVSAPAPVDLCDGEGWQQRRGAAALASLRHGAERTGFRVEFGPGRNGYMGLTYLHERRIEVFVRSCDRQADGLLRHVIAHELGHAYDTTHGTAATRAAWQAARGIPASTPWYGCSGCTDFATPAGDFAEVYAQWLRGSPDNRSELSGDPGPAELDILARQFFGA
jgi:hypothetical protein